MTSRRIPIFDGHNDVLSRLYRRGGTAAPRAFLEGEAKGHLDLPRAQQGGFAGGLFAMFVASRNGASGPNGEAPSGGVRTDAPLAPAVELVLAQKAVFSMVSLLLRIERESHGRVRIGRNVNDIQQGLKDGVLVPVLHIEGAEAIDPNFELLDVLYEAGLRSLGPVWSRPNAFGHGVPFRCPSSPDTGPGLTDLGKELIRACNRLRILIDLSHLNERGFWDVAAISNAPLVATHSNAHALSPHSRNLTDTQLAAISESSGIVGVNFSTSFLRPDGRQDADASVELVIDHLEHILKHVGEDGVGFGSDFDGAKIPAGIGSAAGLQSLVEVMRMRGYGEPLIEKLCYKNWLRVLGQTWGRPRQPQSLAPNPQPRPSGPRKRGAAQTKKRPGLTSTRVSAETDIGEDAASGGTNERERTITDGRDRARWDGYVAERDFSACQRPASERWVSGIVPRRSALPGRLDMLSASSGQSRGSTVTI